MKLSVIVPCYNVALYLVRCLLSIVNQSMTDMEIICIDDKSTDNTLQVLKLIAKNDLRVRILENEENMGVGYTRNRGIDEAKGEFVAFVDPDDWIDSDFYKKLIDKAEQTMTPVVCGDAVDHPIVGKPVMLKRNMKKSWHAFTGHWSAVYLRDFLNRFNIHYPNFSVNEDMVFEAMVKTHVPKPIIHVPGTAYHHCMRLDSLLFNRYSDVKKLCDEYVEAVSRIIESYNLMWVSAPGAMRYEDYAAGVHKYFEIFCKQNVPSMVDELFPVMLGMFDRLLFKYELIKTNPELYTAIAQKHQGMFMNVISAQQERVRAYKLFGKIKIATVRQSKIETRIYLFGIKIWTVKSQ